MKLSSLVTVMAIALMATTAHASPDKGTLVAFPIVQPGTATMFSGLDLRAGEVTDFYVSAKGGDIRCSVFTDRGAPVVLDAGEKNVCRLKVTPKKAGKYTLLVTNINARDAAKATVAIQ